MEPEPVPVTEATILERILEAEEIPPTPEAARYLLSLDFPPTDRQRMQELSIKAGEGALAADEKNELERYSHVTRLLERMRSKARQVLAAHDLSAEAAPAPIRERASDPSLEIPHGIRRSQVVFWSELPQLLRMPGNYDKWVCYHSDECIGIARTKTELVRECLRRGLQDDTYYITIIRPHEAPPWEPEEVEPIHPHHFEDDFPSEP